MRRVLAVLAVVALLVPTLALAATWRIIGQGAAAGKLAVAAASGTTMRPAAIQVKVKASPNIRTAGSYSIQCHKGAKRKKGAGKINGRTPITKAVVLPIAHPDICVVVASTSLPAATRLTLTIRAR